jgi:hypothetical protein
MNTIIGAFVDKGSFPARGAFFRQMWALLQSGPEVVRPRRCGNWEPLKAVADADLDRVLMESYIVSNGRRFLGTVNRPAFRDHRYFTATVHLALRNDEGGVVESVYQWLRNGVVCSLCYQVTRTHELFEQHPAFHQMINAGLVEVDLQKALRYRALFDRVEGAA